MASLLGKTVSVHYNGRDLAIHHRDGVQYVGGVILTNARRIDEVTYGGIVESYVLDGPAHINNGLYDSLHCGQERIVLSAHIDPCNENNRLAVDAVETTSGRFGAVAEYL
jgi:hypothetical protein